MNQKDNDDGEQPLPAQVVRALRQIIRAVELQSRELNRLVGLTGPQVLVLNEIGQTDSLSPGNLAARLYLSQATITGILDRLEAKGLVSRSVSFADKRRVILSLCDRGRDLLAVSPNPLRQEFWKKFSTLSNWEQHMILAGIQRLSELLGAQNLKVEPILSTTSPLETEPL